MTQNTFTIEADGIELSVSVSGDDPDAEALAAALNAYRDAASETDEHEFPEMPEIDPDPNSQLLVPYPRRAFPPRDPDAIPPWRKIIFGPLSGD